MTERRELRSGLHKLLNADGVKISTGKHKKEEESDDQSKAKTVNPIMSQVESLKKERDEGGRVVGIRRR